MVLAPNRRFGRSAPCVLVGWKLRDSHVVSSAGIECPVRLETSSLQATPYEFSDGIYGQCRADARYLRKLSEYA